MRGTVVLTASAGSFPGLAERLRSHSVAVEEHPLIRFAPPADWGPLDAALDAVGQYAAVAVTSPRAAQALVDRLKERGAVPDALTSRAVEIWAAGAGTARVLAEVMDHVHTPSDAEIGGQGAAAALARAMLDAGVDGRVLFPCGDLRLDELPARLRDDGVDVDDVVCYRSVLASEREACEAAERATVLVVGSPSVAGLLARACATGLRPALLAVGPSTAAASKAAGWPAAAVAKHPTAESISAAARALLL